MYVYGRMGVPSLWGVTKHDQLDKRIQKRNFAMRCEDV